MKNILPEYDSFSFPTLQKMFPNNAYFSFQARKKKSTNKMEDKKIDNDIEAKLAEASKAYEDWLTSVEQREEEEK